MTAEAPSIVGALPLPRPTEVADAVSRLLSEQSSWQWDVINLTPAEGLMSETARSVLSSDLASRLSEGMAEAKDPSMPALMHRWAIQLQEWLAELARDIFDAAFVDSRPVSNTMANAMVLAALTSPGDTVAVQSLTAGGNMSYQRRGVCGALGLDVVELPGTPDFRVLMPELLGVLERCRPRVVVVGGSKVLYPYGAEAIRAACDAVGATLLYDAAHVAPFVAAGTFEHPLAASASVMTLSTHKLMGGPVGGLIATNDPEIESRLRDLPVTWFMQTRDLNKYAATVISLAEQAEFGGSYARTVQDNAVALSQALVAQGWQLVGDQPSQTHMVVADLGTEATPTFGRLADEGLMVSNTALFPDEDRRRSGIRMSVAQLTRRGADRHDMAAVGGLLDRAARGDAVASEVRELAGALDSVHYSFDVRGSA